MPMLDWENAVYDEWDAVHAGRYYGMRHKETGERHGIVRWVLPDGCIEESTWKNGEFHGFYRVIENHPFMSNEVKVELRKENAQLC